MLNFIPIEIYEAVYYNVLLFFVFYVIADSTRNELSNTANLNSKKIVGFFFITFVLLFVGLRPISWIFGDMLAYELYYQRFIDGEEFISEGDYLFQIFMRICAKTMPIEWFFFICACLYILPLYYASKNFFKEYWFYSILFLIISLSFWGYAVNGIRNGIATSIFILAISQKKILPRYILILVSFFIHVSISVPLCAYLIASRIDKPKIFLIGWLLCIPLSLVLGSSLEMFFTDLVSNERASSYLTGDDEFSHQFSSLGFRWDFLLYSFSGIFAGSYFIFKKRFEDKTYNLIFNTYVIANSFWVLVIRAEFTNRFAYLSWFLLGLVIVYPYLKAKFFHNQGVVLGKVIAVYFAFTYVMHLLQK